MRSFAVIAAAVGIVSASASASWGAPVYVTDVVTAYTTYCPEATQITHGSVTYTVTEATTLTITNCPCTVTRPVSSSVSSSSICTGVPPVSKPPVSSSGAPVPSPVSSSYKAPSVSSSATSSAPVSTYTGSAAKVQVAGGLLAALGLVAAAL